ncbi:F0F1 ATP synthase subunit B [Macrococcoides bohemicum]|uniref:ATP synthase subunit b n=1 Tax=Macrococcoides bohemicum TaxID=1903056 RepID=A0A328A1W2_9STAP|nr:F0F1 ATP synthase subunit B [Macrococcus bohemicus]QRN50680.1 F0F1 ATP synthase subunit B [Macrococcus bohemicus]RAK48501.1 ATP synthase F0 subunit B [Macrococcus bohemicus]
MKGALTLNFLILGETAQAVPQGVQWGTALYTLALFIILLLLLSKFAWGPLKKIMDERQEGINNDLDSARKQNEDAKHYAEENRALLAKTQNEVSIMMEDAKAQAKTQQEAIIHEANMRANKIVSDAQVEIENEKQRAIADINDRVAELSVLIAQKVINKEINEQDQKQLVQQFIQEAGDK